MRLKLGTNIDLSERFVRFVRLICQISQILFSSDSMSFPRDFRDLKENARRTDGRTDGRTDRRTDPLFRDAWTHLKINLHAQEKESTNGDNHYCTTELIPKYKTYDKSYIII